MSNVYILPRSFATTTELPVTFQQGQRPIRMIRTGAVNGRILNDRRSIRLQGMVPKNTDTSRRVYLAPMIATPAKNHSRTHYQLQPVAPAPTNADFISLQPIQKNLDSENSRSSSFISQQPQMFISDNISQNQQQLSEEDNELDIGEVYRLLDESAGQRISDLEQPRRRERLSNLTLEQKLLRRKQKNRIAAQAARDRKKETNKRLEESLKRAIQEISRLRGELRLLQAQNAQLSASQNLQNNEEKIIQNIPKENIIQRKTFIFPKQEILMATIDDQQQNYQYNVNTSANTQNFQQEQTQMMNQNQTKSVDLKSNFLSSSIASHQSNGNNSLRQSSPSIKPNNSSPFQHDSLGSAASFSAPLPWERESVPEARVMETKGAMDKMQSNLMKSNRGKITLMSSGRQQQNAVRMACMIKVLTALWSIVCEKRETSKTYTNYKISSTNFLKKWTFQSMWTASATKSLKKALLRRMLLMDNAKLLHLCNSPQRQVVAHLLMRTRETLKSKSRLKQESTRKNSTLAQMNNNIYMNNSVSLLSEEELSRIESADEEDCHIVPQQH